MIRTKLTSLALVVVAAAATLPGSAADVRPARALTMAEMASVVGDRFDLPAPPAHLGVEERAAWILEQRPALGRTPMEWIRWAERDLTLDRDGGAVAHADLTTEVLRAWAAAGKVATPEDARAIARAAGALSPAVRAGFADVVATVATVYERHLPLARAVVARALATDDPTTGLLSTAERDLMTARGAAILDAIARFRAHTLPLLAGPKAVADEPLFQDPEGLIVLGGTGATTYERDGMFPDPMLLIEPSGADRYEITAGACPMTVEGGFGDEWMRCNGLALAVVADLGNEGSPADNDRYIYDGAPAPVHGAGGPGGIGILVDVAGNDRYVAELVRGNNPPFFQYFDGGAQGFGYAGYGLLLDALGNDDYVFTVDTSRGQSIWGLGQGFGGAGGLGVASDLTGNDLWETHALGHRAHGFVGVYTNGTGFYGGVGLMTDTGLGDDVYFSDAYGTTTDYYAFGFGAFAGLGILYEDGGDDDYYTFEQATSPFIDPLLNCAYGTASFGGVGVMIDVAGNDRYYGGSVSPYASLVMDFGAGGPGVGYGVFVDTGGDDRYEMEAVGSEEIIVGYGYYEPGVGEDIVSNPVGHNTFGTFVDIGGNDSYIGGGHGENNGQWAFGIDRGV